VDELETTYFSHYKYRMVKEIGENDKEGVEHFIVSLSAFYPT
jgi:hypothetical protein